MPARAKPAANVKSGKLTPTPAFTADRPVPVERPNVSPCPAPAERPAWMERPPAAPVTATRIAKPTLPSPAPAAPEPPRRSPATARAAAPRADGSSKPITRSKPTPSMASHPLATQKPDSKSSGPVVRVEPPSRIASRPDSAPALPPTPIKLESRPDSAPALSPIKLESRAQSAPSPPPRSNWSADPAPPRRPGAQRPPPPWRALKPNPSRARIHRQRPRGPPTRSPSCGMKPVAPPPQSATGGAAPVPRSAGKCSGVWKPRIGRWGSGRAVAIRRMAAVGIRPRSNVATAGPTVIAAARSPSGNPRRGPPTRDSRNRRRAGTGITAEHRPGPRPPPHATLPGWPPAQKLRACP